MLGDQTVQALCNISLAAVDETLEEKEPLRRKLLKDVHADGFEAVPQEMRDPREYVHVPVDGHDGESVALVRAEVERRPARNLRQLEARLAPVRSLEPRLDKAALRRIH